MTKAEAIIALRKILANLYEDVDEAKRIVQEAQMKTSFIKWGGSSITNWFNIMGEAEKRNKVDALLAAAHRDYGIDNPGFQQAYQDYLAITDQPLPQPEGIPARTGPVKILFLAANPNDDAPLQLDKESRAIKAALRKSRFYEQFQLEQDWAVPYTDLQGFLLEHNPDIVHFSGHSSAAGELKLVDTYGASHPVSAQALTELFTLLKQKIRCVVLNACYTDIQGKAIAAQIDTVIGMSSALGDDAAVDFAAGFYEALGFGQNVEMAFKLGCNRINLAGLPDAELPQLLAPTSDPSKLVFVSGG